MKYVRKFVGKTTRYRKNNGWIGEEVKLKQALSELIKEKQLKWFEHSFQMTQERMS